MLRHLCVIGLVVALAAAVFAEPAGSQEIVIYVQNDQTSTVSDQEVMAALPDFQLALDRDYSPVWKAGATLKYLGDAPAPAGAWTILITEDSDCVLCAGYHDEKKGVPYAKVFPSASSGSWTVTFSHELFEMLANPDTSYPRAMHTRKGWYMVEVADPVESDRFSYPVRGTLISDFVEPSWYAGGRRPYDFTRAARKPRAILVDGYQIVWGGKSWDYVFGTLTASPNTDSRAEH